MNLAKLKQAETQFLDQYPQGFMHPEMQAIGEKTQDGANDQSSTGKFHTEQF